MPAVTQMIYDMGLEEDLHGITFECPSAARSEKPKVVRYIHEGKDLSSQEIDTLFSESKRAGIDLYYIDEELLESLNPDIIFTQDVCDVCQIDTKCTERSVAKLAKQPELIPITPQGLNDVFRSVNVIANAFSKPEIGEQHLETLQAKINSIVDIQRANRLLPKRISLLEWFEPIYNCGHWIPDQIALAGGIDMLSNPSGDSVVTNWDKIIRYDPEVIVIAPCGFDVKRSLEEIHLLSNKPSFQKLTAVQNKQVYIVDFQFFTQSSASTLIDGIEILASLFNPEFFPLPHRFKNNVHQLLK